MELKKALEHLIAGSCKRIVNHSVVSSCDNYNRLFNYNEIFSTAWELEKPKTIVDGWINVYSDETVGHLFKTEETAKRYTTMCKTLKAKQVHIHVEFED